MTNPFTAHPATVGETYAQHFHFALRFGTLMTLGGLAALVHALLPFCFVTTAGRISDELVAMRAVARSRGGAGKPPATDRAA
ncbi:MAG: DUF6356 family protein [Casimicrobiaceae bacterium]